MPQSKWNEDYGKLVTSEMKNYETLVIETVIYIKSHGIFLVWVIFRPPLPGTLSYIVSYRWRDMPNMHLNVFLSFVSFDISWATHSTGTHSVVTILYWCCETLYVWFRCSPAEPTERIWIHPFLSLFSRYLAFKMISFTSILLLWICPQEEATW